jgi:hypothetical protein
LVYRAYKGGGQDGRAGYCRSSLSGQFFTHGKSEGPGFRLSMDK